MNYNSLQTEQLVIEVPLLPPKELSPNYRCHWATQHRARTAARDAAWAAARYSMQGADWEAPDTVRITMTLVLKSGRNKIDPDNAIGRGKPFFDGLVQAGAIIDDSDKHVEHAPVRFEIDPNCEPYTRLVLEKK